MTSKEKLTIEQLEYYRNTYEKYDGIESNIFEQICNELIDFKKSKTSTLSECIKEWEDRGFEVENNDKRISFESKKINTIIYADKKSKCIQTCVCHYNYSQAITFDLIHLLSKTLKALEVDK
jgi:hypothetical protein